MTDRIIEGHPLPYRQVSEVDATEAGLPGQPDTTYVVEDGETIGFNAGTCTYWKLGRSPFGGDPDAGQRARTPIGRAIREAQATLEAAIEREGGHLACAIIIVHADGVTPNGGVDVSADEKLGPQSPDGVLSLGLHGVAQLAARFGLPFSVMNAGQG